MDSGPSSYEVTVTGLLGPVLAHALARCHAAPPQACTVIRVATAGGDIVDVLAALTARRLDVEEIFEVGERADRPTTTAPPGAHPSGVMPVERPGSSLALDMRRTEGGRDERQA